jgi:hypothetical protein
VKRINRSQANGKPVQSSENHIRSLLDNTWLKECDIFSPGTFLVSYLQVLVAAESLVTLVARWPWRLSWSVLATLMLNQRGLGRVHLYITPKNVQVKIHLQKVTEEVTSLL